MAKNVGTKNRVLRIVLGLIVSSLALVGPKTPWGWVGLVPLLAGIVSFWPAEWPRGLRTQEPAG